MPAYSDPLFHKISWVETLQIPHSSNSDGPNKNPRPCQVSSRTSSSLSELYNVEHENAAMSFPYLRKIPILECQRVLNRRCCR